MYVTSSGFGFFWRGRAFSPSARKFCQVRREDCLAPRRGHTRSRPACTAAWSASRRRCSNRSRSLAGARRSRPDEWTPLQAFVGRFANTGARAGYGLRPRVSITPMTAIVAASLQLMNDMHLGHRRDAGDAMFAREVEVKVEKLVFLSADLDLAGVLLRRRDLDVVAGVPDGGVAGFVGDSDRVASPALAASSHRWVTASWRRTRCSRSGDSATAPDRNSRSRNSAAGRAPRDRWQMPRQRTMRGGTEGGLAWEQNDARHVDRLANIFRTARRSADPPSRTPDRVRSMVECGQSASRF